MIDKKHPDYPKYKQECDKLHKEYIDNHNALLERNNQFHGKDGELAMLGKKFALELKEIQKKYSYLKI